MITDSIFLVNEASNFCHDVNCDPAQLAIDENDPPTPANPPRPNTGRPIPGFPEDFQPNSSSSTTRRQTAGGDMKGLPGRDLFTPEYHINNHRGELSDFTLYTNITNADGTYQYDTHSLYGHMMATASRNSLITRRPAQRPFVLTRSTFAGSGSKVAHWFGDNNSTWSDYRVSIPQLLAFSAVHQMPMVGSDVCGFNGVADEHMCSRWALLGAFMPFFRNHADQGSPPQEFYLWPSVTVAAQKAIDARYRLLDYIYTAMHRASTTGSPIVNPLFFIYPSDTNTFGIQTQFFYGESILVSPVVDDNSQSVTFYLPDDIFYDFWTLKPLKGSASNITVDDVDWADIPVHIRGGSIIPLRAMSANTTTALRQQNFTMVVAPGVDGTAMGSLYLDDGQSLDVGISYSDIKFSWDGAQFIANGTFGYEMDNIVDSVVILGNDEPATYDGPWGLDAPFTFTK